MNLKVRGIKYHFEIHQEEKALPYLILLHGFMGSGKYFDFLIPNLKQFCNPITIDLLGHGETEGAELHYRFSTKEQIADLKKLITEQLPNPAFLLGYSMGGRMALQLALHNMGLFAGLILESTTFGIENKQEREVRQVLDASRADDIMMDFDGFVKKWSDLPIFNSDVVSHEQLRHISSIQKAQNPLWISNSLLGFGTGTMPSVKERLCDLKIPVQLIVGSKDLKYVHIMNAMHAELVNNDLEIVKNAGHRVHLDQPELYIETIKYFIDKNRIS